MTMFLTYGNDSTGKSAQHKAICEALGNALYISLEVKNRRLLQDVAFEVKEALVIEPAPSYKIDRARTYHNLGKIIEGVLNSGDKYKVVVVDGISEIPKYAEQVVLKEIQKEKPAIKVIGKDNLAAWSVRNNLAYLPFERLASWAEITGANVFLTSLMTDEYFGEKKIGRCVDAKDRLRKVCDVRTMLTNDAQGFRAFVEKQPDWATEKSSPVKLQKGGLVMEFMERGLI